MEEFPSNSRKARDDEKKSVSNPPEIEKVITGKVVPRKKPLGKKLSETFFGGNIEGVLSHVVGDVLVPAAKDAISDAISQGIERMLFGEARPVSRRGGSRPSARPYTPYNRYNERPPREDPRSPSRRARASHDFEEFLIPSRPEAEEVLEHLFELISNYSSASVSDFHSLVGVSSDYTDTQWGWTDIRGTRVLKVSGGYLLDLPKPVELE